MFYVRGLCEGEAALEFLRLLGELLVHLLLFNEPLYDNFPEHRVFECIILLKAR
jgi:hypothetical protein